MSNQTQALAPAGVSQTIHIWMFATAAISTMLVIPHAIVAVMWHWPPTIANLHYVITLGFWIGGVVFLTRRPVDARPLSPEQRKAMTEIDRLNALLDLTDGER